MAASSHEPTPALRLGLEHHQHQQQQVLSSQAELYEYECATSDQDQEYQQQEQQQQQQQLQPTQTCHNNNNNHWTEEQLTVLFKRATSGQPQDTNLLLLDLHQLEQPPATDTISEHQQLVRRHQSKADKQPGGEFLCFN